MNFLNTIVWAVDRAFHVILNEKLILKFQQFCKLVSDKKVIFSFLLVAQLIKMHALIKICQLTVHTNSVFKLQL